MLKTKHLLFKGVFYTLILINFLACNSDKSNENVDSTQVAPIEDTNQNAKELPNASSLASIILQAPNGGRLDKMGKNLSEIKSENLVASDSASNFYTFTKNFDDTDEEFVDIQYYHNNNKINGLVLDVFLNKENDIKLLFDELTVELSKKYGKPKMENEEAKWKLKGGYVLNLKNVSIKLAPGLQLKCAKPTDKIEFN